MGYALKNRKNRDENYEDKIRKLQKVIRDKDKTIRQLKGQVKSAQLAWRATEVYLKEVTDGKPLSEIIKTAEEGKPLTYVHHECPKCNSHDLKKMVFATFYILSCVCGYRDKVDDMHEITKTKNS